MENKDGFNFTYSSKQQEEIKRIREKYEAPKEDQMSRLIFLDRSATKKAASAGLTLGIIGTLLLGFGMSLIMSDLSNILGMNEISSALVGVVLGLLGGVIIVLAYPIYNYRLKKERKKIAPEIIKISDELIK